MLSSLCPPAPPAGPSGSGKSTVLRLLVRLYDVDRGAVLLGGRDVRELRQESLRAAVAVVPQVCQAGGVGVGGCFKKGWPPRRIALRQGMAA